MTPTFSTPIHIALLDDHPLFRQGPHYILKGLAYVEVVVECAELPDVLLLDLQMPGISGPEATELLLAEFPDLKIIVLSMFSADKYITQMVKLGARSYLPKDSTQEQLIGAIEDVLTTGYHFTPRMSRALVRGTSQANKSAIIQMPDMIEFTQREEEVLRLICEGETAAGIAAKLFISRRTVEGHWQRLLIKTNASNVVGLVVFAVRHSLIKI